MDDVLSSESNAQIEEMTMGKIKNQYNPAFKAKVALAANHHL